MVLRGSDDLRVLSLAQGNSYEAEIEDSSLGLDQAVVFGGLDSSSSTEQAGSAQDVAIDLAGEEEGNESVRCC